MNESAENFAEMVDLLIKTPGQTPSIYMDVPLRNGWDTAALMTHMGRDHGISGYMNYVRRCSNYSIDIKAEFEDLAHYGISEANIKILKELYRLVTLKKLGRN